MDVIDCNGRRYEVDRDGNVRVDDSCTTAPLPDIRLPRLKSLPRCGAGHCLAVAADGGQAISWATNRVGHRFGQLGQQERDSNLYDPKRVELPGGIEVAVVAAGENHSAVVDENGGLWMFGCDRWLQLGQNVLWKNGAVWRRTPTRVGGELAGKHVVDAACGRDHSLALTADGRVFAWGRGEHGQCFGSSRRPFTSPPTVSSTLSQRGSVTRVAAHNNCSVSLAAAGPDASRAEWIGQCKDIERARCTVYLGGRPRNLEHSVFIGYCRAGCLSQVSHQQESCLHLRCTLKPGKGETLAPEDEHRVQVCALNLRANTKVKL